MPRLFLGLSSHLSLSWPASISVSVSVFVRLQLDCFQFGQAFSLIFQHLVYVSVSMSYLPIFQLDPRIKY